MDCRRRGGCPYSWLSHISCPFPQTALLEASLCHPDMYRNKLGFKEALPPHCTLRSHRGPRGPHGTRPPHRAVGYVSWMTEALFLAGGRLWQTHPFSLALNGTCGSPHSPWLTFSSRSVGSPLPHRESTASLTLIPESLIFSEDNKNVPEVQFSNLGYVAAVCPV